MTKTFVWLCLDRICWYSTEKENRTDDSFMACFYRINYRHGNHLFNSLYIIE
jgi:hypothetical protein